MTAATTATIAHVMIIRRRSRCDLAISSSELELEDVEIKDKALLIFVLSGIGLSGVGLSGIGSRGPKALE